MWLKGMHIGDHLHELVVRNSERTLCQERRTRIPSVLIGKGVPPRRGEYAARTPIRVDDCHLAARTSIGHQLQFLDIVDRCRSSRGRFIRLN